MRDAILNLAVPRPQPLQGFVACVLGAPFGVAPSLPHRPPRERGDDSCKYNERQNDIHWVEIRHGRSLLFVATPRAAAAIDLRRAATMPADWAKTDAQIIQPLELWAAVNRIGRIAYRVSLNGRIREKNHSLRWSVTTSDKEDET